MEIFNIFSTREIAIGIWFIVLLIFIFIKSDIRKSAFDVFKAALVKHLIVPFIVLSAYTILIIFLFTLIYLWKDIYIKDIVLWFLFAGIPICYNAFSSDLEKNYFINIIFDNFKLTSLIEFFLGFFTFNIITELIIVPLFTFFILVQTVTKKEKEYYIINKYISIIKSIFEYLLIVIIVINAIIAYSSYINNIDFVIRFWMPFILSIFYLPCVYVFALFAKYYDTFKRMSFRNTKDKQIIKNQHWKIIKFCKLSYKKINLFEKTFSERINKYKVENKNVDDLIHEFINEYNLQSNSNNI